MDKKKNNFLIQEKLQVLFHSFDEQKIAWRWSPANIEKFNKSLFWAVYFDCIILGTMLKSSCVCWVHSRLSLWTSEKLLWNQRVEVQKTVCLFWLLTKILKCTLQSVFKTSKKCFVRLEKYVSAYLIMLITVENFEQINK